MAKLGTRTSSRSTRSTRSASRCSSSMEYVARPDAARLAARQAAEARDRPRVRRRGVRARRRASRRGSSTATSSPTTSSSVPDGRVRVADFGLAQQRWLDAARRHAGVHGARAAHGGVATAASDQFALCTALREALAEEPAWLRPIVARGLAVEPAARWPSMAALIAELDRDPGKRTRQRASRAAPPGRSRSPRVIGWTGGHADAVR